MKRTSRHSTSPKRITAIQTSRHLHMAHRKHTGKLLPRTSTSYPMLAMLLLVIGVLITSWTHIVMADTPVGSPQLQANLAVQASVPGSAPTQAATISSPLAGSHFQTTPILVEGTCPSDSNTGYVSLYRNNFFSGSALCDASGRYQLSTDLFVGSNQLIAKVYSFTDIAGPESAPTTVYYEPAGAPSTSSNPKTKSAAQGFSINSSPVQTGTTSPTVPLTLSTDFAIWGYYVGQPTVWQLDLEGGSPPYAIAIDWGDGSSGIASQEGGGLTHLTHTYQKPGGYRGSYIVKFTVTDGAGSQAFLQLLVVVNSRHPSTVAATSPAGGGGFGDNFIHFLHNYIWPSYGLVLLMLASFWLGERREYHLLKPHHKRPRHA